MLGNSGEKLFSNWERFTIRVCYGLWFVGPTLGGVEQQGIRNFMDTRNIYEKLFHIRSYLKIIPQDSTFQVREDSYYVVLIFAYLFIKFINVFIIMHLFTNELIYLFICSMFKKID
jgi:hypothetical protein